MTTQSRASPWVRLVSIVLAAALATAAISPFVFLCFAPGCASVPGDPVAQETNRWAQGRSALTAAENAIHDAYVTGRISPQQRVDLNPYILAARAALETAQSQIGTGSTGFEKALNDLEAALRELAAASLQAGIPPPN